MRIRHTRQWLIDHKFDGLCFPEEECGCGIDDLYPAQEPGYEDECPNRCCVPGYSIPCDCGTAEHTEWIWASERMGIEIQEGEE